MRHPSPTSRTFPGRDENGFVLYAGGERYRLNHVGRRIVFLCDGMRPLEAAAGELASEYAIPYETAVNETVAFCDSLAGDGLLSFSDAPSAHRWPAWHEQTAPLSVTVEITQRCNMRCIHCYNASGDEEPGTLCFDEIARVLGELAALGTRSVSFAGGEPLMRPDLDEMVALGARLGISTGIASNGFSLTPARVAQLADRGLTTVQISLDFPDERHDAFRKRSGAFAHAEAAIRAAAEGGMQTVVSSTVTRDNAGDVGTIRDRGRELGADYHLVNRFIPTRRGASLDADLPEEDFHATVERLRHAAPPMIGCDPVVSGAVHCAVGSGHLTIASNGDVKPCVSFQAAAGNVRRAPLRDIWFGSPLLIALREGNFASLFDGKSPGCPSYQFAMAPPEGEYRAYARVFA